LFRALSSRATLAIAAKETPGHPPARAAATRGAWRNRNAVLRE
jgi:hypothetical protein